MYYIFDTQKVPLHHILQIGEIIHHDFSVEIKTLKKYSSSLAKDFTLEPDNSAYLKSEKSADYWKNKYLKLLEEYNNLLNENLKKAVKPKKK